MSDANEQLDWALELREKGITVDLYADGYADAMGSGIEVIVGSLFGTDGRQGLFDVEGRELIVAAGKYRLISPTFSG